MVQYLDNSIELLYEDIRGNRTAGKIFSLVAMFEWRPSERILEEVFAYMNGEGTVDPVSIAHNRATRSMSVGDQITIVMGGKAETFHCAPNGWERITNR
jgi:hypothetical protein